MNSALLRFTLLALACLAAPAQAQLYKWVDSNGRVQYSDRKPSDGKQSQEVKSTVSAVGSQSGGASGKSLSEQNKEFEKRRKEQAEGQQKQQQASAEQKRNTENCDAARRNLAALESGQRIARYDLKGEKTYMDDSQRAAETQRSRQQIEESCK
jgi:hypothetical protein